MYTIDFTLVSTDKMSFQGLKWPPRTLEDLPNRQVWADYNLRCLPLVGNGQKGERWLCLASSDDSSGLGLVEGVFLTWGWDAEIKWPCEADKQIGQWRVKITLRVKIRLMPKSSISCDQFLDGLRAIMKKWVLIPLHVSEVSCSVVWLA